MAHSKKINLVAWAHDFARERLDVPGGFAVDATAGNGHDTLFLAQLLGENATIAAFDIQPEAIAATRERLTRHELASRVQLHLCGHEKMASALPESWKEKVRAVFFNLGYLPRNDHGITTHAATTLQALDAAWRLLAPGGFISLTIYTRHPGGFEESAQVNAWLESMRPFAQIRTCGEHNPTVPWWAAVIKTVSKKQTANS